MRNLFTFSERLRGNLVNLVNLVMQFLKATKRQSDTTIFAERVQSAKSIFANRGVKDVRVSLGQYPTDIQLISNLSLTINRHFTRIAAVFALVFCLGVGNVWGEVEYEALYESGSFTSVATHGYTQNKTFTLANKSWTASVSQVSTNNNVTTFYLGCNSNNASKGVLNNNATFSEIVTALAAADATYNTNKATAHTYALLFENAYNNVTKVNFSWSGGNNAFQVYLFGYTGTAWVKLANTNYATSGATTAGSVEWTGEATNYTKFAIAARPGAANTTATNKTLRPSTFSIYKTKESVVPSYTISAASNNESYGTVSLEGSVITGSPKSGYRYATPAYTVSPDNSAEVSQNGDEFTVNPSANTTVTINFEAIPTHKISFNTGDLVSIDDATGIQEGAIYNITQTPEASLSENCEYGTFVGWTTASSIADASVKPALVTSVEMGNSDVTLYAVYSKTVGGGGNNGSIELTTETENFPSSYGTANTFTEYTLEGKKFKIQQGYVNGTKLQWRASGNSNGTGIIYNTEVFPAKITSVVLVYDNSDTNKNFTLNVGDTENPTSGTAITPSSEGNTYTFDCSEENADYFVLANGSGAGYLTSITINYGNAGTTTYSLDANCCEPLGAIGGTISWAADGNNLVASGWDATTGGNETGYLVKLYNSDKSAVLNSANLAKATKTHTFTSPGAGTYWVSVTPTYSGAGNYCEEGTETFSAASVELSGKVVITFKKNGANGDDDQIQEIDYNTATALEPVSDREYTAPNCKEFGGWAASEEDANAETPVVAFADGANITATEATVLWAIWNTKTFAITDGTIDASVASHSFSNTVACGSDLTITCAAANAYKGNPTVTATGTHGDITVVSATEVTIANVQSDIAVSIAYETAKANYAITWSVAGEALTGAALEDVTTNVLEGDAIENLPANPSGLACKNTFKGWSTKDSKTIPQTTAYYDDLFTAASGAPAISEATTFYAVFGSASAPSTDLFSWEGGSSADLTAEGNHVTANGLGSDYADSNAPYLVKLDGTGDYIIIEVASRPAKVAIGVKMIGGANTSSITVQEAASKDAPTFTDVETLSISGKQNDIVNLKTTNAFAATTRAIKLLFTKGSNVGVGPISITGVEVPDYVTECAAVEAPTFDVAAGIYNEAQSVSLDCATDGATIKYTTDGTEPSKTVGTEYSEAIAVNQSMTIKAIAIKGEDASEVVSAAYELKVATPTISGATAFLNTSEVTITCAGADHIYYTTDGSDPDNTKSEYSAPFSVDATTTIKAIAVKENWTSSEIASQVFTKVTPMTVAEARTAIDETPAGIANQYVKGIISQIDSYNSTYNSITYWISDDGTTTNQLQVYSGLAGVVKEHFESTSDLQQGAEVIVNGTLKKHNNTVYEFDYNNTIVAYRPFSPIAWSVNAYTAEIGGSNSFPTLSGTDGLTISYSSSDETVATISADGTTYNLLKVGSTTITATSEANASYIATTKSYTLTVEEAVDRYSLSYVKNGGTSDATDSEGETETNLPDPLPSITKAGYNFGGWYLESTFENLATAGAALTENTTLYAQWLDPYTVAQALTMIEALGNDEKTAENVYVAGVVTDDEVSVSSKTATYYIKDASEDNSLEVYKGKGLNNADVTAGDIQEGDQVVVYGQLMKYKGYSETAKPEIVNPNYIYSQVRPTFDVTGVTLPGTANVRAGKTITLTATITPANATNKNVTWSVKSGDTYASVSDAGVVTGLAEGEAVIKVTTEDGGFTAECTVTVAGALPTFTEDDHEWIKITNASKLVAGRFYVIGESSKGVTATNDLSSGYLAKASTTITDGVIASGTLGANTAIFELGGNASDGWTLYELMDEENTGYLNGTDAANLSWSASVATTSISFDESGNAILGNANSYRMLYNSSSPRFKGYNSDLSASMLLPQLYMWAELSHSVTFDANGGVAESVPGVERTDEGKIIIPATIPTHSDVAKAFVGWYKSDVPATLYNAGDEFSTDVDVTLYAKWNTVPTYTVTYVPGGTGTVPAVASYREGQKVLVEEASLSNPGYSFAGWTVKDADQNVLPLDEENKFDMPASNVTITAVWSRISNQKWTLVKQGETLEIDAEYVIAYNSNTVKKALGAISSSIGTPVDVTIDGEVLKGSDAMKVLTLKAGNSGESYALQSGSKYLTWSSGNSLNESETLDDASSWTIDIDENNVATISNVGTEARKLQYNTGSPRFACYTGSQKDVQLYKKVANLIIDDEQTKTAAQVNATDVTVKENGILTINVGDAGKSIGDISIEDGGQLIISGSNHIKANNVYLSATMAGGKSSQMSGTPANLDIEGDVFFDITLGASGTNQQWHAFTVPFPVDVMNGIYDLDGNKLQNEVNYAIMDYHGDIRAQGQYGWKKIRTTLVPGTFYIMATDGYRTTYRFKKTANGALVAGNSKAIYEYASSTGGNDNGWNGIGNPNLFYGKVNLAVQVLDPNTYTFITKTAQSTNFVVGTPFFYQATADGTMVMETANAGGNYAPARERAMEIKDVPVGFGNEDFTDYLYVTANEDALNEYETGKDLAKMTMTSTPKVAQIFGNAYNTKLCMVHTPMVNDNAEVALDLYAPNAGEYTIAAPEVDGYNVYLTQNGNIIWNLSMGEYTADFAKGNNAGYGIRIVKAPQVATGVENVQGGNVQCTKVVIDDHVYILRGEQMFDVTGKAVR